MDERLHSPLLPRRMSSIGSTVGLRLACLPTNILAPDLTAYRARLSDPYSLRADFSLPPVCISVGTHRWVRLYLAFRGLCRFPFPAQLLHAGADSREVVSSTRSAHVSSRSLGRVLGGALWPFGRRKATVSWLILPRKSRRQNGRGGLDSSRKIVNVPVVYE